MGETKRMTLQTCIKQLIFIMTLGIIFLFGFYFPWYSLTMNSYRNDFISRGYKKPHIAIGILSAADNQELRTAMRETWISQIQHAETQFKITYKFLLDEPKIESETENKMYGDILYLNITNHGYRNKMSEKMYVWFKYINEHYDDIVLGIRMDDDVYLCAPEMLDRLDTFQSDNLYYGFEVPKGESTLDELFVVLGKGLIDRIANRKYCYNISNCRSDMDLVEDGFGYKALKKWIEIYDDVNFHEDNSKMAVRYRQETTKAIKNAGHINSTFCDRWLLYHKASEHLMKKIHALVNPLPLKSTS